MKQTVREGGREERGEREGEREREGGREARGRGVIEGEWFTFHPILLRRMLPDHL